MVGVVLVNCVRVEERFDSLLKRDAVASHISGGFVRIPDESHIGIVDNPYANVNLFASAGQRPPGVGPLSARAGGQPDGASLWECAGAVSVNDSSG